MTSCASVVADHRLFLVRDVRHLGALMEGALDGRHFVVLGGDRPVFHVRLDSDGAFAITRVDIDDAGIHRALPAELWRHTLGHALLGGSLAAVP